MISVDSGNKEILPWLPTPVGVPLPTQHPARHLLRGTTRSPPWSISRYRGVPCGDSAPGAGPVGGTGLSMGKTSPGMRPSWRGGGDGGTRNLSQWSWGHCGSADPSRVLRGSRGSLLPVPCVVTDLLLGLAVALLMGFSQQLPGWEHYYPGSGKAVAGLGEPVREWSRAVHAHRVGRLLHPTQSCGVHPALWPRLAFPKWGAWARGGWLMMLPISAALHPFPH